MTNDIVRSYSESWTAEDGGRWRSGVENAVRALHAAGYVAEKPRLWRRHRAEEKGLPSRLKVTNVLTGWPHSCTVEIAD